MPPRHLVLGRLAVAPDDLASSQDEVTSATRGTPHRWEQGRTVALLIQPPARRIIGEHVQSDHSPAATRAGENGMPQVPVFADGVQRAGVQLVRILSKANDLVRWRCGRSALRLPQLPPGAVEPPRAKPRQDLRPEIMKPRHDSTPPGRDQSCRAAARHRLVRVLALEVVRQFRAQSRGTCLRH